MDFQTVVLPMLEGAKMTVLLFIIAIILAVPLGFLLTLAVQSKWKAVVALASTYIYVMRGTPLLLQLLIICFGLPMIPGIGEYLVLDRFVAACIGFILNYAAYFAEIFRGSLLSIAVFVNIVVASSYFTFLLNSYSFQSNPQFNRS